MKSKEKKIAELLAIGLCFIPAVIFLCSDEEVVSSTAAIVYIVEMGASIVPTLDNVLINSRHPTTAALSFIVSYLCGFIVFILMIMWGVWFRNSKTIPINNISHLWSYKIFGILILFSYAALSIFTLNPGVPPVGGAARFMVGAMYESKLLGAFWAAMTVAMVALSMAGITAASVVLFKRLFNRFSL